MDQKIGAFRWFPRKLNGHDNTSILKIIKVAFLFPVLTSQHPQMVKKEGEWWDQDFYRSKTEHVSHSKETYDSLAAPLQEIARNNPDVADELVNLYQRLLLEVLSRIQRSGETGATITLSKERTEQMVQHLASARIDFTQHG